MKYSVNGNTLVICMQEDIISTTATRLQSEYKNALAATSLANAVELDLGSVRMIDSQGLNLVYGLYMEAKKLKWSFKVINASAPIIHLFSLLKLSTFFGLE